ncbi:MAG: hypothetical protein ACPL7D_01930 [Candidatus Sumerlaeaceae bacterium]
MLRRLVAGVCFVGWSLLWATLSGAPLRCDRSTLDSRLFRWHNDPELFLFGWGDTEQLKKLSPPARKSLEAALGRVRSNGVTRTFDTARVAESLASADGFSSSPYATELANVLGSGGPYDQPVELRIEGKALQALAPTQCQAAIMLADALAPVLRKHNAPLFTFASEVPTETAMLFRQSLRAAGTPCLVGKDAMPPFENGLCALDYVVFDPESFPLPYRDQAALSFARSFAGDCPILIRVRQARFYPELFWLSTGAAGIRYDTPCNSAETRWRRGLCSLMKLSAYRPVQLMRPRRQDNVLASIELQRSTMRLAIPSSQEILVWRVELPLEPVNLYRFWFDPANDVLVQQAPILGQRNEFTFRLDPPPRSHAHVFGFAFIPSRDDRQTTIGPITALWGEIPDEDKHTSPPQ